MFLYASVCARSKRCVPSDSGWVVITPSPRWRGRSASFTNTIRLKRSVRHGYHLTSVARASPPHHRRHHVSMNIVPFLTAHCITVALSVPPHAGAGRLQKVVGATYGAASESCGRQACLSTARPSVLHGRAYEGHARCDSVTATLVYI